MSKPQRSDSKYWQGTRNFDHITYEQDLEEYIYDLEIEIGKLKEKERKPYHQSILQEKMHKP